jgi:hypothetical protein
MADRIMEILEDDNTQARPRATALLIALDRKEYSTMATAMNHSHSFTFFRILVFEEYSFRGMQVQLSNSTT